MDSLQTIKQRFEIIGNNLQLNRAIEKALQVAPTDISILVMGESGVGKEFIPKIIHAYSIRKHNPYIAVNCGAIPEGTIDSELFGHEKGSFTGADKQRKGYFEVADGGTIFLDEVGELPLQTQVRLLRVLETGEFIKVGSSEIQKTNVRIVAATNINMQTAIQKGEFREDLYYRLNTVQINIPALRDRKEDIYLLFRKFCANFSDKYRIPQIQLDEQAISYLVNFYWPGNIRQLKNLAEQLIVVEQNRKITLKKIKHYLPIENFSKDIVPFNLESQTNNFSNEREILFKFLFDMKQDLNDLKALTLNLIQDKNKEELSSKDKYLIEKVYKNYNDKEYLSYQKQKKGSYVVLDDDTKVTQYPNNEKEIEVFNYEEITNSTESLSLHEKEKEFIMKALEKYKGKRKKAADELGISERTLYRKIKQYDLEQ